MSALVVPAPDVDRSVSVDVVPVPPIINGSVIEVVKVGDVPNTATPVPVSSDKDAKRSAEAPVEERFFAASVNMALDAVKSEKETAEEPLSITMFPVVEPPIVRV